MSLRDSPSPCARSFDAHAQVVAAKSHGASYGCTSAASTRPSAIPKSATQAVGDQPSSPQPYAAQPDPAYHTYTTPGQTPPSITTASLQTHFGQDLPISAEYAPTEISFRNTPGNTSTETPVTQNLPSSSNPRSFSKTTSTSYIDSWRIPGRQRCCLALLLCLLVGVASPFNLSPKSAVIFEDPDGGGERSSYFGYAVGLRSRARYNDYWVLVGAPRANVTPTPAAPVELIEPGALYKCPVGLGGRGCRQLVLDDTGNVAHNLWSGELGYHDLKDHGWLGASIDTQQGEREATMVCAPLWKNQLYPSTLLMNGACYSQDSELRDATAQKRLPLTQFSQQNYRVRGSHQVFHYAHGQLGFSAHFPPLEDRVLLGAPGVFNWQGSVVELRDAILEGPGSISKRRRRRQVSPQQEFSIEFVPNPYYTASISDSDYFGYSVSSGTFVEGHVHYVAGAPRGAQTRGKVMVFQLGDIEESEVEVLVERSGGQVGEYFGGAVAVLDADGDQLSDLVVGAPLYSTPAVPDGGAAYFYSNKGGGQLSLQGTRLQGEPTEGGRFGAALGTPGDLNGDGFADLLVGAPYEGPGALYVFLGSPEGLRTQYTQRISARDLPSAPSGRPLTGFGISFSRASDVDGNEYPDVVVGSYSSGHAALLRTRPVAQLGGTVSFTPTRLTFSDTSFSVRACVTYEGRGVPQTAELTVTLTADHQRQLLAPRALFRDTKAPVLSYNASLQRGGRHCRAFDVNVQPEVNNAQAPLGMRLQYWLADTALRPDELPSSPAGEVFLGVDEPSPAPDPITSPVTDPSQQDGQTGYLSFVTGCEDDGDPSCESDVRVTTSYPDHGSSPLVVGAQKRIIMQVEVENFGEPAFLPNVTFSVRRPLDLLLPVTHSCDRLGTSYPSVMCRLQNPLLKGNKEVVKVEVDVEQLTDSSQAVVVNVSAGSNDIELTPADNSRQAALQLAADIQLQLHGSSTEEQVTYSRQSPSQINITAGETVSFLHRHTIVKRGPTPVGEVGLEVEIPIKDQHGNLLTTIYAPEREFQGEAFPCWLEGAQWVSAKGGTAVNLTDTLDSDPLHSSASDTSHLRRRHRQVDLATTDLPTSTRPVTIPPPSEGPKEERKVVPLVSCGALPQLQCATLRCKIGSWPQDSASATLAFRMEVNLTTLGALISVVDGTTFATEATASILSLAPSVLFTASKTVEGSAVTGLLPGWLPGETLPWWWVLLAVLLGLLLLAALIYTLYKLGFFRRKEREQMEALTATLTQADAPNYGSSS